MDAVIKEQNNELALNQSLMNKLDHKKKMLAIKSTALKRANEDVGIKRKENVRLRNDLDDTNRKLATNKGSTEEEAVSTHAKKKQSDLQNHILKSKYDKIAKKKAEEAKKAEKRKRLDGVSKGGGKFCLSDLDTTDSDVSRTLNSV